jgi:hypothetical protein
VQGEVQRRVNVATELGEDLGPLIIFLNLLCAVHFGYDLDGGDEALVGQLRLLLEKLLIALRVALVDFRQLPREHIPVAFTLVGGTIPSFGALVQDEHDLVEELDALF